MAADGRAPAMAIQGVRGQRCRSAPPRTAPRNTLSAPPATDPSGRRPGRPRRRHPTSPATSKSNCTATRALGRGRGRGWASTPLTGPVRRARGSGYAGRGRRPPLPPTASGGEGRRQRSHCPFGSPTQNPNSRDSQKISLLPRNLLNRPTTHPLWLSALNRLFPLQRTSL